MRRLTKVLTYICFVFFLTHPSFQADARSSALEKETIYYLLIDRFYNGDPTNDYAVNTSDPQDFHGGDFQGIIEKLNYIKKMGFTTIRLSPIFTSDDHYHGYSVKNYYEIERHFGTKETFQELVNSAHEYDLKVVIDFPIEPNIPEQKIIEAGIYWVKEANFDGYYFEKIDQQSIQFWQDFIQELKAVNEEFYLLGDLSKPEENIRNEYIQIGFDRISDEGWTEQTRALFMKPDQSLRSLFIDDKQDENNQHHLLKVIDGFHHPRFTHDLVQQNQFPGHRWPLVFTYMYTTPGVPLVFYGSEIALNGGQGAENHALMDFQANQELVEFMERLGSIRNTYPSLTKGDMTLLYEQKGMAVYVRTYDEETTIIAVNNTSDNQTISIPAEQIMPNKQLVGLLEGDLIKEMDGQYILNVNKNMSEIYLVQDYTGVNVMNIIILAAIPIVFLIFFYIIWKRGRKREINE